MAHTLAAVKDVLGDFGPLEATKILNYDRGTVTDIGEEMPKTAADQVMVQGRMASGATTHPLEGDRSIQWHNRLPSGIPHERCVAVDDFCIALIGNAVPVSSRRYR